MKTMNLRRGSSSSLLPLPILIFVLTILHSLTNQIHVADAFPGAAGHCDTGDLSGKGSGHGESGGGPLSNGQLQIKFDNQILRSWETLTLNANQEYDVTLDFSTSLPSFFFRGFLFRVSGSNGEDTSGTFYVGSDDNAQELSTCAADVSGMTHTNRDDKTSVSFKFQYTASANADLNLEVTVVRERAADNWFYTPYTIQIGSGGTDTCTDPMFRFRIVKTDGRKIWRDCLWVANKSESRCSLEGVSSMCPDACGSCDTCVDSSSRFKFDKSTGETITRNCGWTSAKPHRCNSVDNMQYACRQTCGEC